jgi:REP element-mobilizing transposase RayT
MAAGTTPTACVTGANRFQFNSNGGCLVSDLKSHISIRPAMDFGSEVFPLAQRSVSDILQVFNHDLSCSDLNRVADQCLGAHMREMGGYGSLVPRQPAKQASGGLGANRLDNAAGAPDTRTTVIQHPAVEEKWFGIGRVGGDQHPLNAHIDANDTAFGLRFGNLDFVSQAEKPLVAYTLDLGVFPRTFRQWAGISNGQKLTPKCDAFIGAIEVPLPHRRDNGAGELSQSPTLVRLGGLVGGADGFAEGAGQLRRQPHLSKVGIVSFCQSIRVQFLGLEDNVRKPVRRLQPNSKQSVSFCAARNFEFDCADCFHYITDYRQEKTMSTELRRNNHSVSRLLVHLVSGVKYRHAVISDSISEMANPPKGNSSFVARRDCKDELRKKLWGSACWTPSFFAASCGGAPIETLKLYVQSQQTKPGKAS